MRFLLITPPRAAPDETEAECDWYPKAETAPPYSAEKLPQIALPTRTAPPYDPLFPVRMLSVRRMLITPEWTYTPPPWVISAPAAPYGVVTPPVIALMFVAKSDWAPPVIVKPSRAVG